MSKVQKFRVRPLEVEAFEVSPLTSETAKAVHAWCENAYIDGETNHLKVATPYGPVTVGPGDWVVKHDGKFYVADSATFHAKYAAIIGVSA